MVESHRSAQGQSGSVDLFRSESIMLRSHWILVVMDVFTRRLIGTIRREYLDRVFFWNAVDLARKLGEFRDYYNEHRVHRSLDGTMPAQRTGASSPAPTSLDHHAWRYHCRGLFQPPIAA